LPTGGRMDAPRSCGRSSVIPSMDMHQHFGAGWPCIFSCLWRPRRWPGACGWFRGAKKSSLLSCTRL